MIAPVILFCAALQAPPPAARPDPAAARAALHAVMSQPAFANARGDSWQSDLRRRFAEWLTDLWSRTVGRLVAGSTAVKGVAWLLATAALSVLLAWLLRMSRRGRTRTRLAIASGPDRRAPARELALQAVELIRAGRTRDAARVAYRAAVYRLEEEGAFAVDDSRTPREYLRALPSPHRRRPALAALTGAFERLWYGSRAGSHDEGQAIVALLQELECLSREHAS